MISKMNIINVGLKFNGALNYGNIPNKIILHNADASNCTIQDIYQWHLNNGWSGIGYHYYVRKDGSIYKGRSDNTIGAHCKGSNTGSLGICFEGRYMTETMPQIQYNAGIELIKYLFSKYGNLAIYGHKELFNTDCPGIKFPLNDFKQLKDSKYKIGWNKNKTGWWYCVNDKGWYYNQGWQYIKDTWYWFNEDGYMRTGWLDTNGYWYYLKDWGGMARNETLTIGDKEYKFNDKGEWVNE